MKTIKKIIIFVLTALLTVSCFIPAFASEDSAELLSVYSDGMLFRQGEEAVIEGTAKAGSNITVELKDKNFNLIQKSSAAVNTDGTFYISFIAPEGSFEEYTLTFFENGKEFRTLKNIVFGELWLASGQSNMQYPLIQSLTGAQKAANNEKLSYWLRVLLVPAYPEYKGSTSLVPGVPQNDITDAVWVNGENYAIYSMSAVAYFFAEELMRELNMPIGILNSSLGGSALRSWLSREAIDSSPEIKQYLYENGAYIEESNWNEAGQNIYQDMTANFNQKIAPLSNFRLSGMIWYQGETDLMIGNTRYGKEFDLMQKTYTDLFSYTDGLLPIIYTQLASYYYSDDGLILSDWNINYSNMQKNQEASRAVTTIYDIPVTYIPEAGLIHPEHKEEVGDRMAYCAMGMVYGASSPYTAAAISSSYTENNSIYVTFDNTGDGLMCTENTLKGFSICGENGIYVEADAEIISEDTVKIFSESIPSPVSAAYAYGVSNQDANLYASVNGKPALPVSAFVTDNSVSVHHWFNKPWTSCDSEKIWYTENDSFSGFYNLWNADNAQITYENESAYSGKNGLKINAQSRCFSVSPTLTYKDNLKTVSFNDADTDYSDYGALSFYVRNSSSEAVTLENVRFCKNSVTWYAPATENTLDCSYEIPADNQWHKITLDLNRIYHLGNECSLSYGNDKLKNIKNIEFCFSSADKNAEISFDRISFSPEGETSGTRYDVDIHNADNLIELFTAIVLTFVAKFAALFSF